MVRIVPVPVVPEPARIGWASGNRDCGGTRESSQIYCDDRDVSRELLYLAWVLVPVPVPLMRRTLPVHASRVVYIL